MKKRVLFFFLCFCLSIASYAQQQVRGNVTDNQGEPIPGVTILEKGTQHGIITDINDNYNITVEKPESILQFSFVDIDT